VRIICRFPSSVGIGRGVKRGHANKSLGLPRTVAVAHNLWTLSRRLIRVLALDKVVKCGRVQLGVEFLV
jgi:hypothetical protein